MPAPLPPRLLLIFVPLNVTFSTVTFGATPTAPIARIPFWFGGGWAAVAIICTWPPTPTMFRLCVIVGA